MGLKELINGIFGTKTADPMRTTIQIGGVSYTPAEASVQMQKIADSICRDYIASAVSKCEIRTFERGKEIFGKEYYRWNVQPNSYQTSTEFWSEIIGKLYTDFEVLILPIGEQLIIADGWSKEDFALKAAEFTGVNRGTLDFNRTFTSADAIYFKVDNEARQQIIAISQLLNKALTEAVDKYIKDGGEHGTLELDTMATGTEEGQQRVEQLLNEDFARYYDAKNAVLPLYEGMKYERQQPNVQQKTAIVTDIKSLLDEAICIVAQSRKVPPALILGNVADTKKAVENFLTFCVDPLLNMVTEAANAVLYGRDNYLRGTYMTADSSYIMHMDIFEYAVNADKLRAASICNTNELRRKLGEPLIPEEWADEYALTKNYENVSVEQI